MMDKLGERLKTLQSEYEAGQKMLADLDARRAQVQATVLRIEGAIQVLNELLAPAQSRTSDPVNPSQRS